MRGSRRPSTSSLADFFNVSADDVARGLMHSVRLKRLAEQRGSRKDDSDFRQQHRECW